jgi:hypothetical protein
MISKSIAFKEKYDGNLFYNINLVRRSLRNYDLLHETATASKSVIN